MKKHLVLLLALVATITMASCTRGKYYVKYDVSAPSSHFYGGGTMTLNLNTETGMQRITSSNGVFSGTFGPVSNGFAFVYGMIVGVAGAIIFPREEADE